MIKPHPALEGLKQAIEDLVKAMGISCELVLHDLRDPSCSIIAIAGDVTGRKVGGPLTDLGLRLLRSGQFEENLIAYSATFDGKPLRSSAVFIRDESGEVIGVLCINVDLTYWLVASKLIAGLCDTKPLVQSDEDVAETFEISVTDMLKRIVGEAIKKVGRPVSLMQKAQKMEVVRRLDKEGIFLIRGAIEYVADALCVSRPTIYNYLSELRNSEQSSPSVAQVN
jgi:predicted transcriptional regulator YheO